MPTERDLLGGWCFSWVWVLAIGVGFRDNRWYGLFWVVAVTLGLAPRQAGLMKGTAGFVGGRVGDDSIWAWLHRECHVLFPDELFADLFTVTGRRSVPPRIVATVMVLQRLLGLTDREAVEAFEFDARWKYACGGLDFDYPGFVHTVLVDMRARLARSERPRRIFEVSLEAARRAGVVSAKRVLDSTPLYDAVATQDTVTMIRSAIRQVLAAADADLEAGLRGGLRRDDDYASGGKPSCDWDDPVAREELVAELAADAFACLAVLDGLALGPEMTQAAELLAKVVGQDLEAGEDGRFRIARTVAKDRVISTVDRDARHGHKTEVRGFDGYKGHIAVDPDSEIITDTIVTPGNAGDASVAEELIDELGDDATVFGDSAYGTGEFQAHLDDNNMNSRCRTQPPAPRPGGLFTKDRFHVDLEHDTVTCPNDVTVPIRRHTKGEGVASFAEHCATCPLHDQCTTNKAGRSININVHEAALTRARQRQTDPEWQADYRANRPKVERKLAHLMRRRHGGRRARVRGKPKVDADFNLLAAATNLARLATLGLRSTATGWSITT
jgi:hypothetical protein